LVDCRTRGAPNLIIADIDKRGAIASAVGPIALLSTDECTVRLIGWGGFNASTN
jgi:cobyric acid synthase